MELGVAVRNARRKLGWSQARLATQAGVSRPALINLERGNPHGEIGIVFRIVAALGLAVRLIDVPPTTTEVLDALLDDLLDDRGGGEP